jgi:addiction module HigA family antidote
MTSNGESAFCGLPMDLQMSKSLTIIEMEALAAEIEMIKNGMRPVHPGEVLREEYLVPLTMSVSTLAGALRVHPSCIEEIVRERQGISADTALRLSRYFGTTAEFWLNLQMTYDLRKAVVETWDRIAKEVEPFEAA